MPDPARMEPNSDCPSVELLLDFCFGRLSNPEAAEISSHLASCTLCEKVLSQLESESPEDSFLKQLKVSFQLPSVASREYEPLIQAAAPVDPSAQTVTNPRDSQDEKLPSLPEDLRVGSYQILSRLGRGGMGVVYHAYQETIHREVALKMIVEGVHAADQTLARFKTEGTALARLQHPNVIQLYEFGVFDGLPFYSMELVLQGSLQKKIDEGPLDPRIAASMLLTLAKAAEYFHQKGVVHRDLKPNNILLSKNDIPKIADFGLAKLLDRESDAQTVTSAVLGTPSYMAPEQAKGLSKEISPATDVYALGCILYAMLTGVPPFQGESKEEILRQVCKDEPIAPSIHSPKVPRDLEAICLKCLEKKQTHRYLSAQELADDLERFLAGQPTIARPRGRIARFWRKLTRRPRMAGVIAASILLPIAIGLAIHYGDPNREARIMQQEVSQSRVVELLTKKGEPRWHEWHISKGGFFGVPDQQAISFQSFYQGLLLLIPKVGVDRFKFRAEVRHDQGLGEVGIFFGFTSRPTEEGQVACYYTLTFNDVDKRKPKEPGELLLNIRAHSDDPNSLEIPKISKRTRGGIPFPFNRSGRDLGLGPWRKLEVVVTPESIRTWWDGQLAHELTQTVQEDLLRNWLGRPELANLGLQFNPQNGLGLLVDEGAAAFRNVFVEPLSSADNSP